MTVSIHSRRMFLTRVSALCAAAAANAIPAANAAPDNTNLAARTAVQWARIKRTLSPTEMAGCRKVAEKFAPRVHELLKGPDWQTQTLKTIALELKAAGVIPVEWPPLDPKCAKEAERLRGEAQDVAHGPSNAIAAALAVAAAAVATVPVVGPIIAAILLAIAAVIILIGQILAKTLEDQAAAKERQAGRKEAEAEKKKETAKKEKETADKIRELQSDLVAEMESHPDCEFKKKPD